MSERVGVMQKAVTDPIVEHVESGQDVRIEGCAASERLDAAAAGFDERFNLVRVTAPACGLTLSALIAQLSGREKFDDHDDGALEAGFRRLAGLDVPGRRTVLLLDATHGVQRAVLRYLQQVGRNAPELRFVITGSAELTSYLGSPDMARLRERLETVVEAGAIEAPARDVVPGGAMTIVPASFPIALAAPGDAWALEVRHRASVRKQRRSRRLAMMWATSAAAMVASLALGAWLGRGELARPAVASAALATRHAELTLASVPATVAAPPLAASAAPLPGPSAALPRLSSAPTPARSVAPMPATSVAPVPALAKLSSPEAVGSGEPPAVMPTRSEAVTFASVEERLSALVRPRASEARRPAAALLHPRTLARSRAPLSAPSDAPRLVEQDRPVPDYGRAIVPPDEPVAVPRRARARFAREPVGTDDDAYNQELARRYGDSDPPSARYVSPGDGGYIGTYSTGPHGARVFRYDP